jgi:hypothetical protein
MKANNVIPGLTRDPRNRATITSIALLLTLLLTLAFPTAAMAAPTNEEAEASPNLTMEYRYAEGETVNIPQTLTQGGTTYHLISRTDPVLESTLPRTRTYTYKIDGNISKKDLAEIKNIPNIVLTPVNVEMEREVDKHEIIKNLPNNDVEYLAKQQVFNVTSATKKTGIEAKKLARAGVTYTVTALDSRDIPSKYSAEVVYRGMETYEDLGYYTAHVSYQTEEVVGNIAQYVIVAQYAPEQDFPGTESEVTTEEPAVTTETIPEQAVPEASVPDAVPEEEVDTITQQFENQTGNPIRDIIDGNAPTGSFGFVGAWSVISLAIVLLSLIWSTGLLLSVIIRRNNTIDKYADISYAKKSLSKLMSVATIVLGVVTALIWYLLDDISLPMVLINNRTALIFVFFLVQIGFFILSGALRRGENKGEADDLKAAS